MPGQNSPPTPPSRPEAKPAPSPVHRPSLAGVPARPDHVIRSMTREQAATVIAARNK